MPKDLLTIFDCLKVGPYKFFSQNCCIFRDIWIQIKNSTKIDPLRDIVQVMSGDIEIFLTDIVQYIVSQDSSDS